MYRTVTVQGSASSVPEGLMVWLSLNVMFSNFWKPSMSLHLTNHITQKRVNYVEGELYKISIGREVVATYSGSYGYSLRMMGMSGNVYDK